MAWDPRSLNPSLQVTTIWPWTKTPLWKFSTGCWHLWLSHSLTFWIDLLRSTAQMHPHCWACRLAFFPFNLFYVLSLNTSLRIFLASPAAATFQHGILTQVACTESMVTLLRSLQYGSKFGLRPLYACQDHTRGWVLVQLYSGNVVFLGPPSLEEYQMHRVQRFNIQGKIYTYVNYSLQFSSEPMRPLSMSLPMTNVSTHRFVYVASTALSSEASSQQRSYFSVLEQVAHASRLQQQLRLFLQDEENPSLNTSLTSANFDIITQKIGNFFPTVSFVYSCLLPTHSLTSFWLFWHSSPRFGPYVYPVLLCAFCVIVSALRPERFESGQPNVFTSYVTISHVLSHARYPRWILTRQPNLKVLATLCPAQCLSLCSWALGCWNATVEWSPNVSLTLYRYRFAFRAAFFPCP